MNLKNPTIILAGIAVLMGLLLGWVSGSRYFGSEMREARAVVAQLEEARFKLEEQRQALIRFRAGAEVDDAS